jgi:hypothetical protein
MTNINDPWRDDEVTRTLNDLPPVDPPTTLVNEVMSTIASRRAVRGTHPSVIPTKRGEIMAKKVLWIVAATAALALITMRLVGYPPVEKGTEATIGAAQRYQSPQISSADVKTEDAQLQAFLQSDLFRQLTTDKTARQALKNKDFQKALQEPQVRAALASTDARFAIAAAKKAAGDALLVRGDAMRAALDVHAALRAAFDASPALRAALASPDVVAAMSNASLGAVLVRPDVSMRLANDAVIRAVLSAPDVAMDAAAAAGDAAGSAKRDAAPSAGR